MSEAGAAIVADRGLVRIAGTDAAHFLNGLVTAEVETLAPGTARPAALLTPQGKILFDFLILNTDDGFILDCQRAAIPDLLKRLTLYKLRSQVEIADISAELQVAALWDGPAAPALPAGSLAFSDPRHERMGWRLIAADAAAALAALGVADTGTDAYHTHRIRLGIPEGGADFTSGEVFPHEACLDQLGGVSFSKGCFIGQEVVSRMEHRGTARSRILPFDAEGETAKGDAVMAGERQLGTVTSVAGGRGLALVRIDRLGSALDAGEAVTAGGAHVTFSQPDWARFTVPGAAAPAAGTSMTGTP